MVVGPQMILVPDLVQDHAFSTSLVTETRKKKKKKTKRKEEKRQKSSY